MLGIEAASCIEMTPFTELAVTIGYDLLASVEHWVRQENIRSEEADYAETVTLHLLLPPAEVEQRLTELRDLTSANFKAETGQTRSLPLLSPRWYGQHKILPMSAICRIDSTIIVTYNISIYT